VVGTGRSLHGRPEVSFAEHEASRFIEDRLRGLGLTVEPCPTPTGALALLDTGRAGRTVMLRADIDALPILEDSGVDFASAVEGRMHGCGHDAHTAILLRAARTLRAHVDELDGRYLFCFQPAEEIVSGAREVIARGLLDPYRPAVTVGRRIA